MPSFLTLPAALSPDQCDHLIGLVQATDLREARVVRGTDAHQIRRAELSWLDDIPQAAWVMDRMMRLVAQANRDSFGFDLTEFGESPQVARYGAETGGPFRLAFRHRRRALGAKAQADRRGATVRPRRL